MHEPEVNVLKYLMLFLHNCFEMRRLEAKNVDFRRRGRKTKTNLVNVTRKDGAIDFYFLEQKVAQDVAENKKVRYDDCFSL